MIDTKSLRTKILDLAMRGLLTEQRPGEKVDFPGEVYTDAPYTLPNNWKWVRIGHVIIRDVGGGTPSKSVDEYWKDGTIPWMSVKDFSSAKNGVLEDTIDHITPEGLENSSSNLVDIDAIIICMRMALGKIVKINQPMAINQDLRAIWLDPCVLSDYFFFYYSTLKVEGHGMTVAGINKKQLFSYMMPLPPIPEQKRIVNRVQQAFTALDTIDELQTQYAENLTVLKSKLIDAAIQGKLTEQLPEDGTAEELMVKVLTKKKELEASGALKGRKKKSIKPIQNSEVPFQIPGSWVWTRLDSVAEIFGRIGFRGYTKNDIVEKGNGALSLSPSNITRDGKFVFDKCTYISWEKYDESPEIKVNEEDIIIVKTGSSYGKCTVVHSLTEKATINPQLAILKHVLCDRYYLNIVLNSEMARKQYEEFVVGAATPTFSQEDLANFLLPLPPLAEQMRIVARLDQALAMIES